MWFSRRCPWVRRNTGEALAAPPGLFARKSGWRCRIDQGAAPARQIINRSFASVRPVARRPDPMPSGSGRFIGRAAGRNRIVPFRAASNSGFIDLYTKWISAAVKAFGDLRVRMPLHAALSVGILKMDRYLSALCNSPRGQAITCLNWLPMPRYGTHPACT